MIKSYKLDKIFGPVSTSSGIFLIISGLIATYFSFIGLVLILIGFFLGFSNTGTTINIEKKRIRFNNNIFGVIPIGKWVKIQDDMKIGIVKSNKKWRTYSRSNRIIDTQISDYRIFFLILRVKRLCLFANQTIWMY
ncbi:MAG: hypothetical protein GYA62_16610 [Bacteroidales bacterium]|nr:hypothetical protein [Bacteroidales bacterium]